MLCSTQNLKSRRDSRISLRRNLHRRILKHGDIRRELRDETRGKFAFLGHGGSELAGIILHVLHSTNNNISAQSMSGRRIWSGAETPE